MQMKGWSRLCLCTCVPPLHWFHGAMVSTTASCNIVSTTLYAVQARLGLGRLGGVPAHAFRCLRSDVCTDCQPACALQKGSVAITPGGIAEMFFSQEENEEVILRGRCGCHPQQSPCPGALLSVARTGHPVLHIATAHLSSHANRLRAWR